MAIFSYESLSENGKKEKGYISADSLYEAKVKLSDQVILTRIRALSLKESEVVLSKTEVLSFTRELSKLLKAGLPLYEGLCALEEKYQGSRSHKFILDLQDRVKEGNSLSKALQHHRKSFDDLYICMVRNAEKSASLDSVLEEIATLIRKEMVLKKQIISSLMYPCLLSLFSLAILSLLLFFIIPSIFELFEGRELHPFTKFVLSLSMFAQKSKFTLLAFLFSVISFGFLGFFTERGKQVVDKILLKIPVIKSLLIKLAFIRFTRSSATLLMAGVPLVETLDLATNVLHQPVLENVLMDAKQGILEGRSFSSELKKSPYVPKLVSRMLGIAEEGGKVPAMMQHISLIYEEEVEKSLQQITSLLQPILLLFIGFIVGFVLLSVLLPLTDVSSFVMN